MVSIMSEPGPSKQTAVAEDRIRKHMEEKVMKTQILVWPNRWHWMVDENKKMYEALAGKRPLSPYDWSRFHAYDKAPGKKGKAKRKKEEIMLPPIPDIPAKPNIPVTTSGWYGFHPKVNGRSIVSERVKWCSDRWSA